MGILGTMGIMSCVIRVDVIVSVISPYSLMMLALPHIPHSTHTPQHPHPLRKKTTPLTITNYSLLITNYFCLLGPLGPFYNIARSAPYLSVLRQNYVMPRLCYGSAKQVNLLCSRLNRKVHLSVFTFICNLDNYFLLLS